MTKLKSGINHVFETVKDGLVIGSTLLLLCVAGETVLNFGSMFISDKIANQKQLETVLKEEISSLGMENKKISARFGKARGGIGECNKLQDGSYEAVLDYGKNRANLRHELYHIYDGDLEYVETLPNTLPAYIKALFINESKAILYQSLKIKL